MKLKLLTRHFFKALFDFGIFSQEGADAFVRVVIGLVSLFIAVGFLLVRMYAKKYGALFFASTADPYAQALLADTTLAIALPMWIVAFLTVLVSHSLFPDETDFRVLMPLPISRPIVFGAKLSALALFAGIFTLTSHLALTPLVALISSGRWRLNAPPLGVLAFWVSGLGASMLALLTVAAINGLLIVCLPRRYVHSATAVTRSAMLAVLVLALPLVMGLPAQGPRIAHHSPLLFLAPPVWFLGVDRVLLGHGDAFFRQLSQIAAVAFVVSGLVAVGSYVVLYRRFDRVLLRSFGVSRGRRWLRWPITFSPGREAVRDFTAATLRRSALHQGVIVGLSACGVALSMGAILRNGLTLFTVTGAPFPLIFLLGIAARATLALPVEPRANWVFRMTERDAIRGDELRAAEGVMTMFAAIVPVVLTLPLQWIVAGPRALVASAMTASFGLLWVELLLHDWRRIPFTCSYMPGKHTVAQAASAGLGVFFTFGIIMSAMEVSSIRATTPRPGLIVVFVLAVGIALLRRRRRTMWTETPLMFTDELPVDVMRFDLRG